MRHDELSIACALTSVRCLRTPGCSGRYAAYLSQFNPLAGSAFLPLPVGRFFFLLSERAQQTCTPRLGNWDTEQPFSYFYELPTQHRLESVATRTPPPICTSALGSLNRAGLESLGRRERFKKYTMHRD